MQHKHYGDIVKWASNPDNYIVYVKHIDRDNKYFEKIRSIVWNNDNDYMLVPKTHEHLVDIWKKGELEVVGTGGLWEPLLRVPIFNGSLCSYRKKPSPKITIELTQEQLDKIKHLL